MAKLMGPRSLQRTEAVQTTAAPREALLAD
jgi:hypothetical protein